jgi:catechol 2,3-dioxygenase-like lactoylglutathione lyase family enzyme
VPGINGGVVAPQLLGFHHVAVQTRDLPSAERFYAGTLGLPVLTRWPEPDGSLRSVWLDTGSGAFLALEKASPNARPAGSARPFKDGHAGWHLVALRVAASERAAWREHLSAAGVPVEFESRWTLYVRDPDGNRVALSHHPDDAPPAG